MAEQGLSKWEMMFLHLLQPYSVIGKKQAPNTMVNILQRMFLKSIYLNENYVFDSILT